MGWRRVSLFLVVLVLSLLAAACGESSDSTTTTTTTVPDQTSTSTTEASPTTSSQPSTSTTLADVDDPPELSPWEGTGVVYTGGQYVDAQVRRCTPDPSRIGTSEAGQPDDISLWAYPVEDPRVTLNVQLFHDPTSRDNENNPLLIVIGDYTRGLENGEVGHWIGDARNDEEGNWFIGGNRRRPISGGAGPGIQGGNQIVGDLLVEPLDPSWENDYISFKLEIPPEIAPDC